MSVPKGFPSAMSTSMATSTVTAAATASATATAANTLHDLFLENVRRHPERTALVDPPNRESFTTGAPRRLSWAALDREVQAMADHLHAQGTQAGDYVCIQLPTVNEILVAFFACWRIGAVPSPVPSQHREHELEFVLRRLPARGFITCGNLKGFDHAALAARAVQGLGHPCWIHVIGSPLDKTAQPRAAHRGEGREHAVVFWTSGTQSQPKPVPRAHSMMLVSRSVTTEAASLPDGAVILAPRMLGNTGGFVGAILPWLDRAGCLVLHQPFDLEVMLAQVRDEQAHFTSCAPAVLRSLLDRSAAGTLDVGRLKAIGSGSASLDPSLARAVKDRLGIDVVNFFGSSEGASLASSPLDIPDPGDRAVLFPRYGDRRFKWALSIADKVDYRLVHIESGEVIERTGVPGELRTRGPHIFNGYLNSPELNEGAFDELGYYRTGDLFELAGDHCQYLRFVGRAKDIIVRGGMNVSAAELDAILAGHPDVADAAVAGIPHERLGEQVCVVVVPRPGRQLTLEAINRWLDTEIHVAVYKHPELMVVAEAIPRNPQGKVVRHRLREVAQATLAFAEGRS